MIEMTAKPAREPRSSWARTLLSLGIPDAPAAPPPGWDDSMRMMPAEIGFLGDDAVLAAAAFCSLDSSVGEAARKCAARIRAHRSLGRLAFHASRMVFDLPDHPRLSEWPSLNGALPPSSTLPCGSAPSPNAPNAPSRVDGSPVAHRGAPSSGQTPPSAPQIAQTLPAGQTLPEPPECYGLEGLLLVVALSLVPRVEATHRRLGIPAEVTRETCRQVRCYAATFAEANPGRAGIFPRQMFWLRHYTDGRLYRMGRFEYMLKEYAAGPVLYKSRRTGRFLALASPGLLYDDEGLGVMEPHDPEEPSSDQRVGQPTGGGDATDPPSPEVSQRTPWRSTYRRGDTEIEGHPIDPSGRVLRRTVRLAAADWEVVVEPGDTIIDVHIPADGPMPLAECADSMRRAVDFFASHFPEGEAKAFWCFSWIFGPQLESILPESSNLVRFLRRLYLYPVASTGGSLWFVFQMDDVTGPTAPQRNTLQRRVAEFLTNGGRWRDAAMLFPISGLDRLHDERFRDEWPQAVDEASRR